MELPEIPNFPRIDRFSPRNEGEYFAMLTTDRADAPRLFALAQQHGPKMLVPEVWSMVLPRCGVLISSALSGGCFTHRVEEAAQSYPRRCWLLVEPMATEFPLPFSAGSENKITIIDYGNSFNSDRLCCQYAHFIREQQGFVALWDTEHTILRKLELAKAAGFLGYVTLP